LAEPKTKNLGKSPPLQPRTSKAADYHEKTFLPKVASRLDELRRTPVSIFICGPSDANNLIHKKKVDTVNALRLQDFDAILGEEVVEELKGRDKKLGIPVQKDNVYEEVVALESEAVIIFHASPGSIAEFNAWCQNPKIAHKILVFADKAHKKGYSSKGPLATHAALYNKVRYYDSPKDIEECNLLTQILEYARTLQAAKWTRNLGVF
jgi:hypothetical protein